jgi:hypothetical protein
MKSDLCNRVCVLAVEGRGDDDEQTRNQIRPLVPSSRNRLAARLCSVFAAKSRPASLRKGRGVTFQRPNREPARAIGLLKHTMPVFGRCCGLGAREDLPIHRPNETENDCPLNAAASAGQPRRIESLSRRMTRAGLQHSEDSGFPFLFTSRSDNSHMKRLGLLHLFFGGLSLFSALSFPFTFPLPRVIFSQVHNPT